MHPRGHPHLLIPLTLYIPPANPIDWLSLLNGGGAGHTASPLTHTPRSLGLSCIPCWSWHPKLKPTQRPQIPVHFDTARELARSQTEQKPGPGGKQVSFHWYQPPYLLPRFTSWGSAGSRHTWGTEVQGRRTHPTSCPPCDQVSDCGWDLGSP